MSVSEMQIAHEVIWSALSKLLLLCITADLLAAGYGRGSRKPLKCNERRQRGEKKVVVWRGYSFQVYPTSPTVLKTCTQKALNKRST